MWKDHDVDGDEALSRAEFGQFMAKYQDTILFQECDVNDDGTLDKTEAVDAILQSGFDIDPSYVLGVWSVYDEDGSGKLDEKEFLKLMQIVRQKSETNHSRAKHAQVAAAATGGRPAKPVCGR
eukprot:COSAG06_NODE_39025_length_417_cov_0.842767_1_plen_122_part_01